MKKLLFTFCLLIDIVCFAQPGSLDLTFEPGDGFSSNTESYVASLAIQPNGKIVVGGNFNLYNGIGRNNITRLNEDGSLDTTFNPVLGFNSIDNGTNIYALAIQANGKIIAGGEFDSYNGIERKNLARINSDGSLDTAFYPFTGTTEVINTLAIQPDGKILIGGFFTIDDGANEDFIIRLDTNGYYDNSFHPVGIGLDFAVNAIALQSNGKVIVGGGFTTYDDVNDRFSIARLNSDNTLDDSFDPEGGFDNYVNCLALQSNGKVIAGGVFTDFNGIGRNYIARLNANGHLDNSFGVEGVGFNYYVDAIALQSDGKIVVGGEFWEFDGISRKLIARLNSDGSLDETFDTGTGPNSNDIEAIAIQPDGKIIIGGNFTEYNGVTRKKIARLNGGTVGIDDFNNLLYKLTIYPNPATTEITVSGYSPAYLKLCNAVGQTVAESKSNKLYVGNLSQGLYVLQLFDAKGQQVKTEKVIVAK